MPIKYNYEYIKQSFENEGYILLSKEYKNNRTKMDYICPKGHKHSIDWFTWNTMNRRCPFCAGQGKPCIEDIKKEFESEGYTLLSKEYKNNHTKLDYICPVGHKHSVIYKSWKNGYRCPKCKKINYTFKQRKENIFINGIIYKVINNINGKVYIGQTIQGLDKRRSKHESSAINSKTYFHKAINKYGKENFTWKVIEYCDSKEEMDEMEFHYIKQYDSIMPNGYNMTLGGEGTIGRICSDETKYKISKSKIGKHLTVEHKLKLSNIRKGKSKSKNHVLNVAKAKSKLWAITFPSGEEKIIKNLSKFCREEGLNDRGMWMVSAGRRVHHKGYKCRKLN